MTRNRSIALIAAFALVVLAVVLLTAGPGQSATPAQITQAVHDFHAHVGHTAGDRKALRELGALKKKKKKRVLVSEVVARIHAAITFRDGGNGLGYMMCYPDCYPDVWSLCVHSGTSGDWSCCRKRDGGMTKCYCQVQYEPNYGWYGIWIPWTGN